MGLPDGKASACSHDHRRAKNNEGQTPMTSEEPKGPWTLHNWCLMGDPSIAIIIIAIIIIFTANPLKQTNAEVKERLLIEQRGPWVWWIQNCSHDKAVGRLWLFSWEFFDSCWPGWFHTGDTGGYVVHCSLSYEKWEKFLS